MMKHFRIFAALLALLLLTLPVLSTADTYLVPDAKAGKESFLCDNNEKTYLVIPASGRVELTDIAEGTDGVWISWFSVPGRVHVDFYGSDGVVMRTETITPSMLNTYLPLNGATAVRLSGTKMEIAEFVPVADEASIPFESNDKPADVVLLLTHVGDESLVAAPILKTLTDYHLSVQICYIYNDLRDRKAECIQTLRAMGIPREPIFWNWQKPAYDTLKGAQRRYQPSEARKAFASLLSLCAPKIWITDGLGAGQIVEKVWPTVTNSVAKNYVLTENGPITLTLTDEEAAPLNEAYRLQASRRVYRDGVAQSVSMQLLTEGAEPDLLAGLAPESFLSYASPTPIPTPTPTPSPTPTPTPTPSPTPAPTDTPVPATEAPHYEDRSVQNNPTTPTPDASAADEGEAPLTPAGRPPVSNIVWLAVGAAALGLIVIGGISLVQAIRRRRG